ncbi:hypothetical protein SAMN02927937_02146 [Paenimyroides aquimaris]|uniref:Uncharacterized protein n=1 Tax=Paenimyroides marinum TaxID=1159016 RepID=A0A1H6M3J8_9FLAO|nr:hypothetical protein [Paenimyroides aquimaris]SEH92060.1 hypothetical protein SAMN02927937_02146 [Paenimyroides aquimaris]
MLTLNIKTKFVYGWFSLRNIKLYVDGVLFTKFLAQGTSIIEIPDDTQKLTFVLGKVYPYKTNIYITEEDRKRKEIFMGLHLNHRNLLFFLYDSLRTDYLRSVKLTIEEYASFGKDIYQQEIITLKDNKTSIISLLVSLVILVFSVVQQENELSPIAFMIGLSSTITSLVYFNDLQVEKTTYKSRMISTMLSFVLATLFLENSFLYLRFIIVMFTLMLFTIYLKEVQNQVVKV